MKLSRSVLVDGNNLLHRAHAIFVKSEERSFYSPTNYQTGLIYGFLSMLSDWFQDISNPTNLSVFFDGVSKYRLGLDPNYKKKEDDKDNKTSYITKFGVTIRLSDGFETDNDLDILVHLLNLIGIDVYRDPQEEADDLIASYTSTPGVHVIISSDRDFYQLLSDNRIILYRPGPGSNRFYDAEAAEADLLKKYSINLKPQHIRMFKSLTGDPSDRIPGIPRLRKKIIASFCSNESVENLYGCGFPGLSKKELENVILHKDRVKLNWELIGLRKDLDFNKSKIVGKKDLKLAEKILREDLGINTIHPSSFQVSNIGVRTQDQYDIPDFLKDI